MAWNIVIAGGGFAGANVARRLERIMPRQSARLILVNDVNFILYAPMLPEAAAGTLEPRHVVTPLREVLRRTDLRLGAVTGHDPAARTVEISTHEGSVQEVSYDHFVITLGSVSRSLPIPGLNEHAMGFKSLADAVRLRNTVIESLEFANSCGDRELAREILTFVFIGGGYAGLEALAELQDLAVDVIDRYPQARLHGMRWVLVEAADRVLPMLDQELAEYAVNELRGRGIDIRLGTTLDEVTPRSVRLSDGEEIPTRTVVWTAGVKAHPSLGNLNVPLDETGRVPVDDHLRVEGMTGVWAAGDCAAVPNPEGGICPPTAQHAIRQARTLATNVAADVGLTSPEPFTYRSRGAFVNLGRYKAVAATPNRTFSGFLAWWMARTYHLSQIPGWARKLRATADWTISLPFARDTAEVGSIGHPYPLTAEEYAAGGTHRPMKLVEDGTLGEAPDR